jgi:hypothetical protein
MPELPRQSAAALYAIVLRELMRVYPYGLEREELLERIEGKLGDRAADLLGPATSRRRRVAGALRFLDTRDLVELDGPHCWARESVCVAQDLLHGPLSEEAQHG